MVDVNARSSGTPGTPRGCQCPEKDGKTYHQRDTCTDPVVAKLDWYTDSGRIAAAPETKRAATPGHAAAGELVDEAIKAWLNRRTDTALAAAGSGDLTDYERGVRQGIERLRHLHLDDYWYTLTPAILEVVAAATPATSAPGDLLGEMEDRYIEAERTIDNYREEVSRLTADRDLYYKALQRIVDAVAAGDAAAVDKLARNALGLTRTGRPAPFHAAPALAALASRWEAEAGTLMPEQEDAVRSCAAELRKAMEP